MRTFADIADGPQVGDCFINQQGRTYTVTAVGGDGEVTFDMSLSGAFVYSDEFGAETWSGFVRAFERTGATIC